MHRRRDNLKAGFFDEIMYAFVHWDTFKGTLRQENISMSGCKEIYPAFVFVINEMPQAMNRIGERNRSDVPVKIRNDMIHSRNNEILSKVIESHKEIIMILIHEYRICSYGKVFSESKLSEDNEDRIKESGCEQEKDQYNGTGTEKKDTVDIILEPVDLIEVGCRFYTSYTGLLQHRSPEFLLAANLDSIRAIFSD